MFEHFEAAEPRPGNLRRLRLAMLPGAPVIDVEHVGETNKSWMADQARRAGTSPVQVGGTAPGGGLTDAERAAQVARFREVLAKHSVRHLHDVKHSDGTPATDADIAAFCASLPAHAVTRIAIYVLDVDNFLGPSLSPEDLAGKS